LRRFGVVDSLRYVPPPPTLSALSRPELEALLAEVLGEVSALKQTVAGLREEIARLKGLKGRPEIKPSGMEKGIGLLESPKAEKPRGRGKVTPRVKIEEKVIRVEVPPGSVFKGHEPFLVQDLVISANATCYLRQRDLLPASTLGHAGWTDYPGVAAGRDRWSFWSGTSPLCVDAVPSGPVNDAPAPGLFAITRRRDLEAAVGPIAKRGS
jgi:hypothetical protein